MADKALLSHVLGVRAAVDLAIPTGVDASEVFKFEMRTKKTAEQVLQEAAAAMGALNASLTNMYAGMFLVTDSLFGFTRQGESTRSMTPRGAEFSDPDPVRSSNIGNMLPIDSYADALGWTEKYLRNAVDMDIVADIQLITERFKNRFDFAVIKRMLTNTENAIGSAGYDVGWAIGTGTNVNYIPPQFGASLFDSTHSHYVVEDDDTKSHSDLLEDMVADLREHGFSGNLVALVSDADIASYRALTNFAELIPPEIIMISGNSGAPVSHARGTYEGMPGELFGFYRSKRGLVELRTHVRIPTKYAWMTRPYGPNNVQNAFAIRVYPGEDFGLRPDAEVTNVINPKLKRVNFTSDFGIGVNSRLNGCAGYIASGATVWVNPSDSALGGTEL